MLMASGGPVMPLPTCDFNEYWSSRPPMAGLYSAGAGRASSCRQLSGTGASPFCRRGGRGSVFAGPDAAAALLLGDGWSAEGAATDAAAPRKCRGSVFAGPDAAAALLLGDGWSAEGAATDAAAPNKCH
jgi:hypothetical protein